MWMLGAVVRNLFVLVAKQSSDRNLISRHSFCIQQLNRFLIEILLSFFLSVSFVIQQKLGVKKM